MEKISILGLIFDDFLNLFLKCGFQKLDAKKVFRWIHKKNVTDFVNMTDVSKSVREKLNENFSISIPKCIKFQEASDGTRKALLSLYDNNEIETVLIPDKDRMTVCVSSQIGCLMGCKFCNTGTQSFVRNLSSAEIIAQILFWNDFLKFELSKFLGKSEVYNREIFLNNKRNIFKDVEIENISKFQKDNKMISNIVFMGMGEPLLNAKNLFAALTLLLDENTYNFSRNKITVSTSGVINDEFFELAKYKVKLAISLHASNDSLRSTIMPINKKYPLKELIKASMKYQKMTKNCVTFEYLVLDGFNDSENTIFELMKLLKGKNIRVNLIMFNPWKGALFKRAQEEKVNKISAYLIKNNVRTIIRKSRGRDILAACGQLKTEK